MKRNLLIVLGLVVCLPGIMLAQAPALLPTAQPTYVVIEQEKAPPPLPAQAAPVVVGDCTTTICVTEVKKNTKVVYTSRCKEYCVCVPHHSFFGGGFGDCNSCGSNADCEKRTKNVLIKKVVPDCDTTQCVLKEVPATCVPCPPCPR